mgnify:CR=1 FL=1
MTTGAAAAHGLTQLELYRRWRAKARVATKRGGSRGPYIWARGQRWRPTAAGGEMEGLWLGKKIKSESRSNPAISKRN